MAYVLGIDLGTANSCVAVLKDGKPEVIADSQGNRTTPSIFSIASNQEPLVGFEAQRFADKNRENTIFAVKRFIGKKYNHPDVQDAITKLPYKVIAAENQDAWVIVNGAPMSPEEVSSHVLIKLREIAEAHLGERVYSTVITVPAHFNDSQRQATRDAGRIAGLEVLGIINEPTAAALAYGMDLNETDEAKQIARNIAVFDLGGGTFDITILRYKNGLFDVLSTGGNTFLGGEDFDLTIGDHLIREFHSQMGVDLRGDKAFLQRLKEGSRKAKEQLSFEQGVMVEIPFVAGATSSSGVKDFKMPLDRKTLERICAPLLARLDAPCTQAIEDAKLRPEDITDVILVGGMTRMPAVKSRCAKLFGRQPIDSVNPDEAVARGAAIQAGLLKGALTGISLSDVIPLTLGIEVQGGLVIPMMERNTKFPAQRSVMFTTSMPGQTELTIHIVQGESTFSPENKSLGKCVLRDIPPAKRGEPKIDVTLSIDNDGIVHVTAKNLDTGKEQGMEIINSSGLNDKDIEHLLGQNRQNESFAELQKKRIEDLQGNSKINSSDSSSDAEGDRAVFRLKSIIFQTQFKLDYEGESFRGEKRRNLENCLAFARTALKGSSNEDYLNSIATQLEQAANELEEHLDHAA